MKKAYDMRRDPSVTDPDRMVGYAGNLDPSSPTDLLIAIPGMFSNSFEGNPLGSRDSYAFFLNPLFYCVLPLETNRVLWNQRWIDWLSFVEMWCLSS